LTAKLGYASEFGPLAREAKNALVVIKRHGFTSRTVEILIILLLSFFENCFWLAPQAHDQIRAEIINFVYKARLRKKLTKTFIARRFKKILHNLILAGYAIPRKEYPVGLFTGDENLDAILSRLTNSENLEIKELQNASRQSGVKHKAQIRDFILQRGIENKTTSQPRQQTLFDFGKAA